MIELKIIGVVIVVFILLITMAFAYMTISGNKTTRDICDFVIKLVWLLSIIIVLVLCIIKLWPRI